jgi:hypothetical protein
LSVLTYGYLYYSSVLSSSSSSHLSISKMNTSIYL